MDTINIATIIIRNTMGQFYSHQRNSTKRTFPNLYGLGAGGHIQDNETPAQAAKRELMEETGIDAEPTFLFSFLFEADSGPYTLHVHEVLSDADIHPDDGEWQWSGWLSQEEVDGLDSRGKLMPDTTIFYKRYIKEELGNR